MASNNALMMRFTREMFAPNGKRELSSTSDVDTGLANTLLGVLDGLTVSDARKSALPLKQFLVRSARDKLKFGDFDDVEALLRAMRAANGGRRDDGNSTLKDINRDALPVINLGRSPGFQMHDNTICTDEYNAGHITNAAGKVTALLSLTPVEITYSVMVLAAEKETLSALVGVLATWLRQFTNYGNSNFTAKSRITGCDLELDCLIRDPKGVFVNDLTLPLANNRVFAASIPITVIAPLYTAWLGAPATGKIEVFNDGVAYSTIAPAMPPHAAPQPFNEVV